MTCVKKVSNTDGRHLLWNSGGAILNAALCISLWASANVMPNDFQNACRFSQIYTQKEIYYINNNEPFGYILKHLQVFINISLHRAVWLEAALWLEVAHSYLHLPNYLHQVF